MSWRLTSVRGPVLTAGILASSLALVVAAVALMIYEASVWRRSAAEQVTSLAHVLAVNCAAPLVFESRSDAKAVLDSLAEARHLETAALYDGEGRIFATLQADSARVPAQPLETGHRFAPGYLEVFQPVEQSGNRIGTLYLRSALGTSHARIQVYGWLALGAVACSLVAGFFLCKRVQSAIPHP